MPKPTYEAIATTTLVSTATNVDFTSIPATYTDLIAVWQGSTQAALITIYFNSDTTNSNYSVTMVNGNGTSALSARYSVPYLYNLPPTSGTQFNCIVNVQNYSNTTTFKTFLSRSNVTDNTGGPTATVGLWRNTAAISTLRFERTSGNFPIGTTISLYGVKSA
jgi:hypothetical protein